MQDHIFVLLMQTGTSVAKVLQFFTRKPYNHASVALDLTLEEMYSFCRNHIHFPLPRRIQSGNCRRGHVRAIFGHPLRNLCNPRDQREKAGI